MTQGKDKGPQSVYLDEARHDRVSRMVANALGNKGSLSRFFGFVEDRTFEHFGPLTFGSGSESTSGYFVGGPKAGKALWNLAHSLPAVLLHPLDSYTETWRKVEGELAWFSENPAAAHILALTLLTPRQELWKVPPLKQPGILRKGLRQVILDRVGSWDE